MSEAPKPRLTLVDRTLEEQPEPDDRKVAAVRAVLVKHAPTIAKLARSDERADILRTAGAKTIDEFSQLAQLRAERDARPTREEELKHGRHRFYQGISVGIAAGALLTIAIGAALIGIGTEATVSGVAVGRAVEQQAGNVDRLEALDRAQ